jgi:L-ascorbate 6-phosphate lactonase
MKITWLTQAGLLFENGNITVMVDPYFSNSVGEQIDPKKNRRIPADESFLDKAPDVVLITHDHLDHLDPETIEALLARSKKPITFLAPENAYNKLKKYGGCHNYVMLNAHSVWSERGITFYAVHAEHSDRTAVGFILDDGERTFYVSGDTLYNFDVIDEVLELVEDGVDFAFVPINGKGNNMNAKDAADFVYEIDAKRAVPLHYGLFDNIDPETFDYDSTMTLEPFKTVEI